MLNITACILDVVSIVMIFMFSYWLKKLTKEGGEPTEVNIKIVENGRLPEYQHEGDVCLDMCAAPGGKSTQIAAKLNGTGILVSNEIIPSRAKILSWNIERMGIKNAVVLNETPKNIAKFIIIIMPIKTLMIRI